MNKYAEHYIVYLKQHIENVQRGYEKLLKIIPDLFYGYDENVKQRAEENIKNHDNMKFDEERLRIYGEHFLNVCDREEYNKLIWEHIRCCGHHFQHWLVHYTRDDIRAIEMPYEYIVEMVCDWLSFSYYHNEDAEIVGWYAKNREKMIFAPKTQKIVDDIILKIARYYNSEEILCDILNS